MSRELVIRKRCDECGAKATETFVVGVTTGEVRPRLFVVDACELHAAPFASIAESIRDCAPWQGAAPAGSNGSPADRAKRSKHAPGGLCDICGVELTTRGSLVNHIWAKHANSARPAVPTVCPDCGAEFPTSSMGVHRSTSHAYNALGEAYAAAGVLT